MVKGKTKGKRTDAVKCIDRERQNENRGGLVDKPAWVVLCLRSRSQPGDIPLRKCHPSQHFEREKVRFRSHVPRPDCTKWQRIMPRRVAAHHLSRLDIKSCSTEAGRQVREKQHPLTFLPSSKCVSFFTVEPLGKLLLLDSLKLLSSTRYTL